jgi:hypothetical protein
MVLAVELRPAMQGNGIELLPGQQHTPSQHNLIYPIQRAMLVSLTVGKVDAGVAVLLTEDKRLVRVPMPPSSSHLHGRIPTGTVADSRRRSSSLPSYCRQTSLPGA